jgi:hypothetical protein
MAHRRDLCDGQARRCGNRRDEARKRPENHGNRGSPRLAARAQPICGQRRQTSLSGADQPIMALPQGGYFVDFLNAKQRNGSHTSTCSTCYSQRRDWQMAPLVADRTQADDLDDRRQNPDRRGSGRRKTLRGGRILWPNGDASECTVCNLSETGAQLIVRGPVPNLFDLVIEGDQWRDVCAVVWRRDDRVGVKFKNRPRTVAVRPVSASTQCRHFANECRKLANRAAPTDRKLLLEMADMWISVTRKLARKSAPSP